jgi:hypothetical protein
VKRHEQLSKLSKNQLDILKILGTDVERPIRHSKLCERFALVKYSKSIDSLSNKEKHSFKTTTSISLRNLLRRGLIEKNSFNRTNMYYLLTNDGKKVLEHLDVLWETRQRVKALRDQLKEKENYIRKIRRGKL